jgi:hypothetical protein
LVEAGTSVGAVFPSGDLHLLAAASFLRLAAGGGGRTSRRAGATTHGGDGGGSGSMRIAVPVRDACPGGRRVPVVVVVVAVGIAIHARVIVDAVVVVVIVVVGMEPIICWVVDAVAVVGVAARHGQVQALPPHEDEQTISLLGGAVALSTVESGTDTRQ